MLNSTETLTQTKTFLSSDITTEIPCQTEEKECQTNINDDCPTKLLENIAEEQLRANKEVTIGEKSETEFSDEALVPQLQQKISEIPEISEHPSTDVTDTSMPQEHQASTAQIG